MIALAIAEYFTTSVKLEIVSGHSWRGSSVIASFAVSVSSPVIAPPRLGEIVNHGAAAGFAVLAA